MLEHAISVGRGRRLSQTVRETETAGICCVGKPHSMAWNRYCVLAMMGNRKNDACTALVYGLLRRETLESFDHFDQVGQRVCLHLIHRVAAMNLYCSFGSSNLGRDLLIEHA
jgi:hypothetical protein